MSSLLDLDPDCYDNLHDLAFTIRDSIAIGRSIACYCEYSIEPHINRWFQENNEHIRELFLAESDSSIESCWGSEGLYDALLADFERYTTFWVRAIADGEFEIRNDCPNTGEWSVWCVDRGKWQAAEARHLSDSKDVRVVISRLRLCHAVARHLGQEFCTRPRASWVQMMPDEERTRQMWRTAINLCGLDRTVCYMTDQSESDCSVAICECPAGRPGSWTVVNAEANSLWQEFQLDHLHPEHVPQAIRIAKAVAKFLGAKFECDPEHWRSRCRKKQYQRIVRACTEEDR